MALEYPGLCISLTADEDLSGHQYRYVVQASDTNVRLANAATDIPIGVLQNAPVAGKAAVIMLDGISKVVANAQLAVGAEVKLEYVGATDNGKCMAVAAADDLVIGIIVQASGAEDDVASVKLVQYRKHA